MPEHLAGALIVEVNFHNINDSLSHIAITIKSVPGNCD